MPTRIRAAAQGAVAARIGIQAIGQEAKSEQGAAAFSLGLQHGASNDNAPVRVDSKGDGGSVEQSNSVDSARLLRT